jgi:hypothetical protein
MMAINGVKFFHLLLTSVAVTALANKHDDHAASMTQLFPCFYFTIFWLAFSRPVYNF